MLVMSLYYTLEVLPWFVMASHLFLAAEESDSEGGKCHNCGPHCPEKLFHHPTIMFSLPVLLAECTELEMS